MRNPIRFRRMAALAATYVVVLQALLLPLAVAATAPRTDVLCVTSGEGAPAPAHDNTGCACAAGCGAQCCVPGLLGAARDFHVVLPADFYVLRATSAPVLAPRATLRLPQIPRAPPAA
jgi:hypothetical protein